MPLSPVSTYVHASFAKFTCSRFSFVLLCIWCLQINWIGLEVHTHTHTFILPRWQAARKRETPIVLATRDRLTDEKETNRRNTDKQMNK